MAFRGLTLIQRQKRGARKAGKRKGCSHWKARRPDRLAAWWRK